jgi:HEAT repeat protein
MEARMSHTPPTLDELVATLARANPSIDDAMNQRIKARIEERIRMNAVSRGRGSVQWAWRATISLAAAALLAVMLTSTGAWRPGKTGRGADIRSDAAVEFQPTAKPLPLIISEEARRNAQDTLRAALSEAEPTVRMRGSDALSKIKDQESIPKLTAMAEGDPDAQVRGHAAEALGQLNATATVELLEKLERAAPPPLKVWYASSLARLGNGGAAERLYEYARNDDLAVSFKAVLSLADISQPGDQKALAVLRALARRERELNAVMPYAGAVILTKMTALRDASARDVLVGLLQSTDEGVRLAAAEGLAKLGDDSGRTVLEAMADNPESPNQLAAAVAQIPIGQYGGLATLTEKLNDKDPEVRGLAARGLGDIGEKESLRPLLAMASNDTDWTVRVAAAGAIIAIVGNDPIVLAQASVDWTRGALDSQNLVMRQEAASVLADIPDERQAVPLLAKAIADEDARVRLAASRSASKMRSGAAASQVAYAVAAEKEPAVKEQQVVALGEIGRPEARDALSQIATEPGRIGVIASGSLVAVGDTAAGAKLEKMGSDADQTIRLAAMQAASLAKSAMVVPTLQRGLLDKAFDIRFTAAIGLSLLSSDKEAVVGVLTEGLHSKDPHVVSRAMVALMGMGAAPQDATLTAKQLLASKDPEQRMAAVPLVKAMPTTNGVPLLRQLLADLNREVRRAGVDAIEDVTFKNKAHRDDKSEAIKLYKPLIDDTDRVVRAKAQGQLSRLMSSSRFDAIMMAPPASAKVP